MQFGSYGLGTFQPWLCRDNFLAGERPVALVLCLGFPFGCSGPGGGTGGLCGWKYGEREVASLRAILDSADATESCKADIRAYLAEGEDDG